MGRGILLKCHFFVWEVLILRTFDLYGFCIYRTLRGQYTFTITVYVQHHPRLVGQPHHGSP